MAISTRCCLKFSPPTPSPTLDVSSSKSKTSQIAWPRNGTWRKQCVIAAVSMVIGLQVVDMYEIKTSAIADEISFVTERWSEKRMCPPWQANSLETIVPENLPRPSARRRWEAIGLSQDAPVIKVPALGKSTRANCFSM